MEEKENCLTCENCISKHYTTIRCAIWTFKIKDHLYKESDGEEVKHSLGRMWNTTRCQYYEHIN